jgi:hypothetical protein
MDTLRMLSYRGVKTSDISNSALYRIIESYHPTLFLDESEIYTSALREDIQGLLNSGYRRGDQVIRVLDHTTNELGFFDVFGFKVISGTDPMKTTLESRCIKINMSKNIRPVSNMVDGVRATELRNKLLYYRGKCLEGYDGSNGVVEGIPDELNFTDGRHAEIYSSLVNTAKRVWM